MVSPDYQITALGDVHTLHIPEVFDEDTGRFTVMAENDAGKASCSALLVIVDESLILPSEGSPPPTPQIGVAHESFAPASHAPPLKQLPPFKPVPPPQPVTKPAPPQPVTAAPPPPKPAPPPLVLPKFGQPLRNTTAEEGNQAVFETSVISGPDTTVRWLKDGQEVLSGPRRDVQFKNNRATLTIADVAADDAGRYTCSVTNPAGTAEVTGELIVKGKLATLTSWCFMWHIHN